MAKLSDQLTTLADRTKKTETTIDAARDKDRKKLTTQRTALKTSADKHSDAVKADFADGKSKVNAKTSAARASVDARFAEIRDHAASRKADHDSKKAGHQADVAEQDASDALDLALYTLDLAEYAIVDAAILRADADDLVTS